MKTPIFQSIQIFYVCLCAPLVVTAECESARDAVRFFAPREAHAREHSLTSRVRLTLSHHGHSQTGPPSSPIARPVDVAITPKKENQIRLESGLSYLLMGVADR